ncbi:MAG: hypothetical protein JW722_02835 [Demequinaceae bacterium]|nr:hypothetical protein [Demequinaceae bacterium]
MGPSTGWAAQQPLFRLGIVSTVGLVVAVLCAELVGMLGSSPGMALIAPVVTAASLGVVAAFCWFSAGTARFTTEPSAALRRVRDALAGGLGVLFAVSVASSFSGERVGLPTRLHVPLAIVVAVVAVAFAWVAIAYVRRDQAFFTLRGESIPGPEGPVAATPGRRPLERMHIAHGLVAGTAGVVTLMLFAAGATPYVFPFAGLMLVPSVSTWAYATLRMSRLDRRPLPEPNPDRPPRPFRTARLIAIAVLTMVPVGVLWWVWLTIDAWGLDGVDLTAVKSKADLVLLVSVIAGVVAAVVYPFLAVAEALRTPMEESTAAEDDAGMGSEPEPLPEWTIEKTRPLRAPVPGPL